MTAASNPDATIYDCLDEMLSTSAVKPGVKGRLFNAIDQLRASEPGSARLRLGEQVSIAFHRLEAALRRGDSEDLQLARAAINALEAAWTSDRAFRSRDHALSSLMVVRRAGSNSTDQVVDQHQICIAGSHFSQLQGAQHIRALPATHSTR